MLFQESILLIFHSKKEDEEEEMTEFITDLISLVFPLARPKKTTIHKSNPGFPTLPFTSLIFFLLLAILSSVSLNSKYANGVTKQCPSCTKRDIHSKPIITSGFHEKPETEAFSEGG